jgi:hypothetical protein
MALALPFILGKFAARMRVSSQKQRERECQFQEDVTREKQFEAGVYLAF